MSQSSVAFIEKQPKVVFSLHGIRTRAAWQRAFSDIAIKCGWRPRLERWNYGYFSSFRFLMPSQRRAKVEWFNKTYQLEMSDRTLTLSGSRLPSIVAHSLGTYILGNALLKYESIRLNKVILCGSILPRDFPWHELIDRGQVQVVRNEYGVNDIWSKLVSLFVSGTGDSGVRGFLVQHPRLEQQVFRFEHSDYFDKFHMRDQWMPFLGREIGLLPVAPAPIFWTSKTRPPFGLYALYVLIAIVLISSLLLVGGQLPVLGESLQLHLLRTPRINSVAQPFERELLGAQNPASGGIRINRETDAQEQVWTTAQTLRAVIVFQNLASQRRPNIQQGFQYIESQRLETGWGLVTQDTRTVTEIAAWVSLAYIESLRSDVVWDPHERQMIVGRVSRDLSEIASRQASDGGFVPFGGNVKDSSQNTRTYSTVMAVWAIAEAEQLPELHAIGMKFDGNLKSAVDWLGLYQDSRLGWVPNPNRRPQDKSIPGLDAQTYYVLSLVSGLPEHEDIMDQAFMMEARKRILDKSIMQRSFTQNEELNGSDQQFGNGLSLEGMDFLWFPWYLASFSSIQKTGTWSERVQAEYCERELIDKIDAQRKSLQEGEMFIPAELLIGLAEVQKNNGRK